MEEDQSTPQETGSTVAIFVIALVFAVMFVIAAPELFEWIDEPDSIEEKRLRSDVARNYALGVAAFVGIVFAWIRTMALDKQANEAIRQGKRTDAQLRATEESNEAEILQKSAILTKSESEAERDVGVALLFAIAEDKGSKYRTAAIDLTIGMLTGAEIIDSEPEHSRKVALRLQNIARSDQNDIFVSFRYK